MQIHAALAPQAGAPFVTGPLTLDDPRADEVLVRIAGVGICHTDLVAQAGVWPVTFPAVLGHEGAGIVERVGAQVTKVQPGDRVLLSFTSCGHCPSCSDHEPAYCYQLTPLNIGGPRSDGTYTLHDGDRPVTGNFFGQSSFATHSLARERNIVKVPEAVPLDIAGILGCGVQTGAGAILRSMDCKPGRSLLVIGGGAVGLSAVMAAKARGLGRILLAERLDSRRAIAMELGVTDFVNPTTGDMANAVLALVPNGVDYVLDTTGVPVLLEQVPRLIARRGTFGFVGLPPASHTGMNLPFGLMDAMRRGLTLRGIIEGDSDVDGFIGSLMELYLAGRFPFDKLVRKFPMTDINHAIEAQHRGDCVKVVLIP
jgi:aryl-alcohol dehydrogenase